MDRCISSSIALSALLVSVLLGLNFTGFAHADQFYVTQSPPSITIRSPASSEIYGLEVPLKFTINYYLTDPPSLIWGHGPIWIGYSLDGVPYATIQSSTSSSSGGSNYWESLVRGSTSVDVLLDASTISDGLHTVTIKADFMFVIEFANSGHYNYTFPPASFTVKKPPLTAQILSPYSSFYNSTSSIYNSTDIPLNFTVNRQIVGLSWMGYSLDNQVNVTVGGNTTLTGLIYGFHNLAVYVNDTFGNMVKAETVAFSIAREPEPQPESFPMIPVAASIATVAIVGVGLLVYFKKHKGKVE